MIVGSGKGDSFVLEEYLLFGDIFSNSIFQDYAHTMRVEMFEFSELLADCRRIQYNNELMMLFVTNMNRR